MHDWWELIAAGAVFFATHIVPVQPPIRAALVGRMGSPAFGAAYGIVSTLALAWLIVAAGRAPHQPMWDAPTGSAWAPWMTMVPAVLLVAFALGRPNPFSFGGARKIAFDADRPGVVAITRHPILAATALWAAGHAVANPDLAHLVVFGGFTLLALVGMAVIDRRTRAAMGEENWRALADAVRRAGPWQRPDGRGWLIRATAALVVYGALVAAHGWVIGVAPWVGLGSR